MPISFEWGMMESSCWHFSVRIFSLLWLMRGADTLHGTFNAKVNLQHTDFYVALPSAANRIAHLEHLCGETFE